jgi:hypothetical protein
MEYYGECFLCPHLVADGNRTGSAFNLCLDVFAGWLSRCMLQAISTFAICRMEKIDFLLLFHSSCVRQITVSQILITAGIAIDASRPVYSLSSNSTIPDSLLDKELHSGVSFNVNIHFVEKCLDV